MVPRSGRPAIFLTSLLACAIVSIPAIAEPDNIPAAPAWLHDITRVAYTDLVPGDTPLTASPRC